MSYENQGSFTTDNARLVIAVMMTADNRCEHCVSDMLRMFIKTFPGHRATVEEMFEKEYGHPLPPAPIVR